MSNRGTTGGTVFTVMSWRRSMIHERLPGAMLPTHRLRPSSPARNVHARRNTCPDFRWQLGERCQRGKRKREWSMPEPLHFLLESVSNMSGGSHAAQRALVGFLKVGRQSIRRHRIGAFRVRRVGQPVAVLLGYAVRPAA